MNCTVRGIKSCIFGRVTIGGMDRGGGESEGGLI